MTKTRTRVLAGLDIGSHKVACFIAELDEFNNPRLIGYGQHAAGGMKRGMIVDMDRTENAIREAVQQAEDMGGVEVSSVIVGLGGVHLRSHMTDGLVVVNQQEISDSDLNKVIDVARAKQLEGDRKIIHAEATRYVLDNQLDIRDPRGMTGSRLEADVHIISAAASAVRNVVRCVERANLEVQDIVIQPYASAISSLVDDEKELGVALVDIGGGTSDIAIYSEGHLVYTAVVPLGGQHITADIARGLSTPLAHAERIKALHGCAMASLVTEEAAIEVPHVGDAEDGSGASQITPSQLAGIIQPRAEEILEMVRDRIEQSGFESVIGRRVVLTGGSSQLGGIRQLADVVLDKTSRQSRPAGLEGLTDLSGSPQFATAAGLVLYGARKVARYSRSHQSSNAVGQMFGQLQRLFKDSFQAG